MTDLWRSPVFLSLAAGVLIVLGGSLIHHWSRIRRAMIDADLKREMIERGMSAEEIARVIESRSGSRDCG